MTLIFCYKVNVFTKIYGYVSNKYPQKGVF